MLVAQIATDTDAPQRGRWTFLEGGWREVKERQPGMMLLIAMAIKVAYAASMATSLDWFSLDFWWELALLVAILGDWQEMKAHGQAQDALAALAALLPEEAERVCRRRRSRLLPWMRSGPAMSSSCAPAPGFPLIGEIVDGAAELDSLGRWTSGPPATSRATEVGGKRPTRREEIPGGSLSPGKEPPGVAGALQLARQRLVA